MTSHIRAYIQKISTASHRARNAPHARKNKHHPHPTPRRHVNQRRISIASADPTPDQTRNPTATAPATEATVMAEIAPYLYSEGQASHPVIELLPEHWRGGGGEDGAYDGTVEGAVATVTPSFVLDVTWPRVAAFYHPASAVCRDLVPRFVALARAVRHRSTRVPITFHAVSCQAEPDVCKEFGIMAVPTVMAFRMGHIDGIVVQRDDANEVDLAYLADVLEVNFAPSLGEVGGAPGGGDESSAGVVIAGGMAGSSSLLRAKAGPGQAAGVPERHAAAAAAAAAVAAADPGAGLFQSSEVYSDAEASFIVAMEQTVYDPGGGPGDPLPKELAYQLRDYLDLLHWTLPAHWKLHDLINDLRTDYDSVVKGRKDLLRVLDRHRNPGDRPQWGRSCSSGEYVDPGETGGLDVLPEFEGYSCGLLRMFHIISVGVARQHTFLYGDRERARPSHAMSVMRGFVGSFYAGSSRVLRRVFLDAADSCAFDFCERMELVVADTPPSDPGWRYLSIWLCNVHNSIRSGIASAAGEKDKTAQTVAHARVWPTPIDCPKCHSEPEGWDYQELYRHIETRYWPPGLQNPRIVVVKSWGGRMPLRSLKASAKGALSSSISLILLVALGIMMRKYWAKWQHDRRGWRKKRGVTYHADESGYSYHARNGRRRKGSALRSLAAMVGRGGESISKRPAARGNVISTHSFLDG